MRNGYMRVTTLTEVHRIEDAADRLGLKVELFMIRGVPHVRIVGDALPAECEVTIDTAMHRPSLVFHPDSQTFSIWNPALERSEAGH